MIEHYNEEHKAPWGAELICADCARKLKSIFDKYENELLECTGCGRTITIEHLDEEPVAAYVFGFHKPGPYQLDAAKYELHKAVRCVDACHYHLVEGADGQFRLFIV